MNLIPSSEKKKRGYHNTESSLYTSPSSTPALPPYINPPLSFLYLANSKKLLINPSTTAS